MPGCHKNRARMRFTGKVDTQEGATIKRVYGPARCLYGDVRVRTLKTGIKKARMTAGKEERSGSVLPVADPAVQGRKRDPETGGNLAVCHHVCIIHGQGLLLVLL